MVCVSSPVPKVTTSCRTRFHIFDQARELHRRGYLHHLVTDMPRFLTRRWGIPDDKVLSLLWSGVWGRCLQKAAQGVGPRIRDSCLRFIHDAFSSGLARNIPSETEVLITLSSFGLHAIERARSLGICTVVDHGSLHQRVERRLIQEEAKLWGLAEENVSLTPDWIIAKEDREFSICDRIMVLSEAARRSMLATGIKAERVFVNPCGVDLQLFHPVPKDDKAFRVIQCSGLTLGKGFLYLMKAFRELNLPEAELWFIGAAAPSAGLGALAQSLHHPRIFFKGAIPHGELHRHFSQGSVFVLPSIADGFGMVVPQAMACGLPVIVSENVGAADLVSEGDNGYVVPIRDVEALKRKILELYDHREKLERLSRKALEDARLLSWERYGERLCRFLYEVHRNHP